MSDRNYYAELLVNLILEVSQFIKIVRYWLKLFGILYIWFEKEKHWEDRKWGNIKGMVQMMEDDIIVCCLERDHKLVVSVLKTCQEKFKKLIFKQLNVGNDLFC